MGVLDGACVAVDAVCAGLPLRAKPHLDKLSPGMVGFEGRNLADRKSWNQKLLQDLESRNGAGMIFVASASPPLHGLDSPRLWSWPM